MPYSLVVVEKFEDKTNVRVISTFPTEQLAQKRLGETKWAGKRGVPHIVEQKDVPSFMEKHRVAPKPEKTQEELTREYEKKKAQEKFERERIAAKEPTEKGEVARALLKSKYGITAKPPEVKKKPEIITREELELSLIHI